MKNVFLPVGLFFFSSLSVSAADAGAKAPAPYGAPPPPTAPAAIQVAPGFKVELLYTVPAGEQGSWVGLTIDPKGRLISTDQYGGLYRIVLPAIGSTDGIKVERLAVKFPEAPPPPPPTAAPAGAVPDEKKEKSASVANLPPEVGAHGLLYAFDSLYVMVNENKARSGLWRMRDLDGDDTFAEATLLRSLKGSGEHGPHAVVLSPDGKSIYFDAGNMTQLPERLEKSRAVAWGEDHLLLRMWDARGHARGRLAPGGYIARTDPDGKNIEMLASGFRNAFDFAFDQNGELFTYDSDMEWDQGSPWYMPTRINHVVDGADFGWRSGAGRWPAYYADSLPAALNIGPGSPTGTTFGTHTKFPEKYQRAMFAADWTFGTLYAIHLTPDGATFRGEKEEFVSGKPLPLTDVLVNPHDGALYFTVGGRRTQSALYRVTYVGQESTAPAKALAPTSAAKLRHSLEALQTDGVGLEAVEQAWPHLDSPDRFIRWAARVAIERQPASTWAERALTEKRPQASIEALIALARVGDKSLQPRLIESLSRLNYAAQPPALRLPLLRAWELAFTRMGKPSAEVCAQLVKQFDPLFPSRDAFIDRELISLLIYLDSPTVVAKAVPLLSVAEPIIATPEQLGGEALIARNDSYGKVVRSVGDSRSDRQQIALAYNLRNATVGWTPALRLEFFSWFSRTQNWKGGASFGGFIQNIRTESLEKVTDPVERLALDALSKPPPVTLLVGSVSPKGPGRSYTTTDATALIPAKLQGRNFAQGKAMFSATACIVCHRFGGEGGGIGPDLSDAGSRYSVHDLLQNIIEPSLVISDQYVSEQIDRTDGATVIGRVVGEENGELLVMSNPFAPDERTKVPTALVKSRKPYALSMMPPGLLNSLNEEELKDLVAYILSGGNSAAPAFQPEK